MNNKCIILLVGLQLLQLLKIATSFSVKANLPIGFRLQSTAKQISNAASLPAGATDLTGYTMDVTFTGFNAYNMSCAISLKEKFQVEFSRGLLSPTPGFWRVVGYDGGVEMIEATQPVTAEYMFFFDIEEPSILWRGQIDKANMKIIDGVVITNKKRFGLIPYTETLATFTANLLPPGAALPDIRVPKLSDQRFVPPIEFEDPNDMKNFPQLFDPDFVSWWFSVEDSLARGERPPKRTKKSFSPDPKATVDGKIPSVDDTGGKLRPRRGPTTGKKDGFL